MTLAHSIGPISRGQGRSRAFSGIDRWTYFTAEQVAAW